MEKVLDVYKRPYNEDNPVVCMDESPKQLISEARPSSPMKPGQESRRDYEYVRHGMVNIFMANEPLKGNRMVEVTGYKTKKDWAKFVKRIADELYPWTNKITLVMDNFKTHAASALYETFEPEEAKRIWDRFEFIYTPKHGSWLNMAEIELSILSRQCMKDYFESIEQLTIAIAAWERLRNKNKIGIDWQFTTADARIKLRKLYPTI